MHAGSLACAQACQTRGVITRLNPPELHATPGYHHVTLVEPGPMAYLAGQCPLDSEGNIAADLPAQVEQVVSNSLVALATAGAGPADVVRSVIYVVSTDSKELGAVWRQLNESALAPAFSTASTLLGVAALGFAGQRVELDLTAAVGR
jgi:enamine deaminase RidA (YjgF/YER057c/UK114 family)